MLEQYLLANHFGLIKKDLQLFIFIFIKKKEWTIYTQYSRSTYKTQYHCIERGRHLEFNTSEFGTHHCQTNTKTIHSNHIFRIHSP